MMVFGVYSMLILQTTRPQKVVWEAMVTSVYGLEKLAMLCLPALLHDTME